ncbi:asialoglycoprotein receptor 1-like isoform X2 [Hyperolius riggenbachi]|uniref:asialoglycoprotein receptor 1-like isoform X2 n=1 Tax=Hyperolius riggenbachi TaxID=752182 RepID=UPI0035A306B0
MNRRTGGLPPEPGACLQERMYNNMIHLEAEKRNTHPTDREFTAEKNMLERVILVLVVLLILKTLILVVFTSLLFIYSSVTSDQLDRTEWIQYSRSYYHLSVAVRPWKDAKQDCERKNAHLVIINDKEEKDFLFEISQWLVIWIGLTDVDGTWKWVDGTPLNSTPTYWNKTQPDNWQGYGFPDTEDCAQMKYGNTWNDAYCVFPLPYICEKKA